MFECKEPPIEHPTNKTLAEAISMTVDLLASVVGIRNLSINERFIIRKAAERTLPIYASSSLNSDCHFSLGREIASIFLIEAYGIDPRLFRIFYDDVEGLASVNEYIRRTRDRAHLI